MKVRIKDIAEKVNRSITTVSRALNDYDDVSPETKKLVLDTAREMGYSPNILAQRLQKQHSDTIGLVLPTFSPRFSDPYFSELLAGIGNKAAELGYDLLVSTRPPGPQEKVVYEKLIDGGRVDGFIIVRTRCQDQRIDYLLSRDFPFVAFGRTDSCEQFSYVDEDGYFGMQLVSEHLVKLNHKLIGSIAPRPELAFSNKRLDGLRDGLARFDIFLQDKYIKIGDLTQKSGYELGGELLDMPDRPTAIAACNDLMAFGAMSAAQDRGLIVGEDVSITGFDDIPMAEYSHPPLTTVNQPVYKIGNMVCEILINIIKKNITEYQQILLKPSLVIRQSSGLNH
jgi:LacI family transcriptional regulator